MPKDTALEWLKANDPEYGKRGYVARFSPEPRNPDTVSSASALDGQSADGDTQPWDEIVRGESVFYESEPDALDPEARVHAGTRNDPREAAWTAAGLKLLNGAPERSRDGVDAEIERRLTADERRHLAWLHAGHRQTEIAGWLGVSQPAVVKRERKLRERLDAIHRELTGTAHPLAGKPRRPGTRL